MSEHFGDLVERCKKSVEHFKKDIARIRTGRANSALLEGLMVEYYGTSVPLQQLGLITSPEPRQLLIQVYDRGAIESIEKAIQQSELGLNPAREASHLRITIPALTEERRKEFIKKLHKMGEEAKVAVRTNRRDALEALKKIEKAEDALRRGQEEIQKLTDKYVAEVEQIVQQKEKELMEV